MGDCRPEFSRVELMGEGVDYAVVYVTPFLAATMYRWCDSYNGIVVGMGIEVD